MARQKTVNRHIVKVYELIKAKTFLRTNVCLSFFLKLLHSSAFRIFLSSLRLQAKMVEPNSLPCVSCVAVAMGVHVS